MANCIPFDTSSALLSLSLYPCCYRYRSIAVLLLLPCCLRQHTIDTKDPCSFIPTHSNALQHTSHHIASRHISSHLVATKIHTDNPTTQQANRTTGQQPNSSSLSHTKPRFFSLLLFLILILFLVDEIRTQAELQVLLLFLLLLLLLL